VDLSLSTSSTYLQDYACYSISNATITSTSPVSETLTLYTGAASCSGAQVQGGKVHAFHDVVKLSSDSTPSISAAAFSIFGLLLAVFVDRRSRQLRNLWCALVLAAIGVGLSGCGSSESSSKSFSVSVSPPTVTVSAGTSGIPAGNYSITITGTDSSSSSKTASTTMTLTIN
jgi:hypothetical protein